ncbi:MAG: orotate phosphoribosyltransferase [Ferrovum sp. 37-45-19]|uniref:orotate phosphoribosyltransferase n=1 Tax=Ferrovum sp. JA12 TaxID=1356299 RepID=UPI0007024ACD|nr:orotate phosphoribosyltransferase [Ferrovum sp. JA12]OYV80590.1 MAG: orotate phosphoribosyltransferase [Ferrovum sp. 21-44-67]OYV94936.1 MAG: orotate phosphoribosyltransferase [Ferrovum sp. 37-45-19]OZB34186.1 MAG: orotate phosphoribosyltransferase [Ferrovum sp. 34-44-207]HQT81033.1 orotate phosphoribosyltransferase [Ferrovaceae bacterium]KRH79242.1 orotate phosphoribosyltransferase [Ferrovum sp. JA12]
MSHFRTDFIAFAVEQKVLRFGEFTTKAGRQSPYFFNAGLFYTGTALDRLADFYVQTINESGIVFDVLFGPAYKGISLAAAIAIAFAKVGREVPFCYNRKEAKDHGEGGTLVGAPVQGRILIVDDVISAGTSVRESFELIKAAGAEPVGVVTALDRMERGVGNLSAAQEVREQLGIPVVSIANLNDLLSYLIDDATLQEFAQRTLSYRKQYGVNED